jgi:CRISPR-associated protein Csm4
MNVEIWRVTGAAFHFGQHGLGQEETGVHWPSDSLWSAIISRLVEQAGEARAKQLAEALRGDAPPLALSSLFPRAGDVLFFPRPMRLPRSGEENQGLRPKDVKKVKWLSERLFRAVLEGQSLSSAMAGAVYWHDGVVALTRDEREPFPADFKIWAVEKRPRVAVGRVDNASQIYHTGRATFAPQAGLWFAVHWQDESWRTTIETTLADLAVTGLGGNRSVGFGACQIEKFGWLTLPEPADGLWVSLSRYLPRSDEMRAFDHAQAAYAVESVGGWVYSPTDKNQRRRAVRLLAEGAVLGYAGRAMPGDTVDVQPDYNGQRPLGHEVWRSGVALAVGLKET